MIASFEADITVLLLIGLGHIITELSLLAAHSFCDRHVAHMFVPVLAYSYVKRHDKYSMLYIHLYSPLKQY